MAAKSQDKVLFGVALLLLLSSLGWALLQNSKLGALRQASNATITPSAYVPAGIDAPTVSTKTWPVAPSQTRGAEWIYDVFTPPEIYYDANTKEFSVTLPKPPPPPPPPQPFGLSLVEVKQDAFRLQLVGYIGGEGDYLGNFENAITGETIIGRSGKNIPKLDLTIQSFVVKRNTILSKDSMPVIETEATAVVVDTKTGDKTTLSNKRRLIKGSPFAILKADGATETVSHKAGEKFTVGDSAFTVVTVTAEPPSAEILKEAADLKDPVTKTLTPAVPVDAVIVSPTAPEQPAAPSATPPFPFGN
ncbi:MAG: hypothetical protein WC205_06355 [Opitutaceae bacterium]|jgi:hypothetical protein